MLESTLMTTTPLTVLLTCIAFSSKSENLCVGGHKVSPSRGGKLVSLSSLTYCACIPRAFWLYNTHLPNNASRMLDSFDPQLQKHINDAKGDGGRSITLPPSGTKYSSM